MRKKKMGGPKKWRKERFGEKGKKKYFHQFILNEGGGSIRGGGFGKGVTK